MSAERIAQYAGMAVQGNKPRSRNNFFGLFDKGPEWAGAFEEHLDPYEERKYQTYLEEWEKAELLVENTREKAISNIRRMESAKSRGTKKVYYNLSLELAAWSSIQEWANMTDKDFLWWERAEILPEPQPPIVSTRELIKFNDVKKEDVPNPWHTAFMDQESDSEDQESEDSDSEEEFDGDGGKYLAPMEDYHYSPYQSENHITTLQRGEVLCGGMPQGKKRTGRLKGRARKKKHAPRSSGGIHGSVRIRKMGALLPESVIVDLPFVLEGTITSAGSAGAGQAYHLNDSYDVDLALASLATIGFQFYADAYENFRDIRSKINFDHWNQETFPILFFCLPSTENLSAAVAISDRVASNPLGVSHSLQAKGMYGCQRRLIRAHSTCSVVGSKAPLTADNFGGTTSGSLRVADHLYWNFYVKATGGNVLTATGGIGFRLTMTQTVHFYARKALTS